MLDVQYNGRFPSTCMGTLRVLVDGKEIYNKSYRCESTGSVSFTEDWEEIVAEGDLIWEDAHDFSDEIQEAVAVELRKHSVCCGGCV